MNDLTRNLLNALKSEARTRRRAGPVRALAVATLDTDRTAWEAAGFPDASKAPLPSAPAAPLSTDPTTAEDARGRIYDEHRQELFNSRGPRTPEEWRGFAERLFADAYAVTGALDDVRAAIDAAREGKGDWRGLLDLAAERLAAPRCPKCAVAFSAQELRCGFLTCERCS